MEKISKESSVGVEKKKKRKKEKKKGDGEGESKHDDISLFVSDCLDYLLDGFHSFGPQFCQGSVDDGHLRSKMGQKGNIK